MTDEMKTATPVPVDSSLVRVECQSCVTTVDVTGTQDRIRWSLRTFFLDHMSCATTIDLSQADPGFRL
jgi:hypothetical protein